MSILTYIKDIIAPKKCYSCNIEGHFLCPKCYIKLDKHNNVCYVCKGPSFNSQVHNDCKETINYDQIHALFHYRGTIIKKMMHDYKFYSRMDISEDFGLYLGGYYLKKSHNTGNYIILYPPMGFFRKLKRGYNQSELLAKQASGILGFRVENKLIKLNKNKRQQSKLSKDKRGQNIKNSFKINNKLRDKIDKNKFIIIDDVISTGGTINEIAKLLKENGATEVIGLIVASE